jgi:hypothetical protein
MGRIDRKESSLPEDCPLPEIQASEQGKKSTDGMNTVSQWIPGSDVAEGRNPEDDDFYNMTADSFLTLCQKHGTDRILFATDCPWADQKAYVDAFRSLPFTEEEQSAILGGNALKLLGMSDTVAGK